METTNFTTEDVTNLFDKVLRSDDPATVGLRRIIRRKSNDHVGVPIRSIDSEDFGSSDATHKKLTVDETHVLELEKQNLKLRNDLQKLEESARAGLQDAYAKGVKAGEERGAEKGKLEAEATFDKKIIALEETVSHYLATLDKEKISYYQSVDTSLLSLALSVAKKIIGNEISTNKEVVLQVLKQALAYCLDRDKLTIRVSPHDKNIVAAKKDFWAAVVEKSGAISIVADDRISEGGCILESPSGQIDAQIETQMTELESVITSVWSELVVKS